MSERNCSNKVYIGPTQREINFHNELVARDEVIKVLDWFIGNPIAEGMKQRPLLERVKEELYKVPKEGYRSFEKNEYI